MMRITTANRRIVPQPMLILQLPARKLSKMRLNPALMGPKSRNPARKHKILAHQSGRLIKSNTSPLKATNAKIAKIVPARRNCQRILKFCHTSPDISKFSAMIHSLEMTLQISIAKAAIYRARAAPLDGFGGSSNPWPMRAITMAMSDRQGILICLKSNFNCRC